MSKVKFKKWLKRNEGLLYISPWLIGFSLLGLFPILMSMFLGFTEWPIIGDPKWVGLDNFEKLFNDPMFYRTLQDTFAYAIYSIVLGMLSSFTIALLLNTNVKGLSFYRTVFYLPAVVTGVAVSMMWRWILDPNYGLLNIFLQNFGVEGPNWLGDPNWVLPSYVLIAVWGAGGGMLTYLVGLKDIPKDLYEASFVDGASWWNRLIKITIPMMTPILFYNLIMNIIGALRQFSMNYILGGKQFYMLYVYNNAFKYNKMGYASALAWILVIIILVLTLLVFKSSSLWVYHEYENNGGKKKDKKKKKLA